MPFKAFCFHILSCLLLVRGLGAPYPHPPDVHELFAKADSYFTSSHPTAASDSMALLLFDQVIREGGPDALVGQACLNKGILLDIRGNYSEALTAYRSALWLIWRHPDWGDTLRFRALVYAGTDYYRLDNFDSAEAVLGRAEAVLGRAEEDLGVRKGGRVSNRRELPERDRLYNALGALNYEGGNYLQGKDYFTRALDVVQAETPGDKVSILNFQNNIASCLYRLKDYKGALKMYGALNAKAGQVCLNIGQCYKGLGDYAQALAYYRRVNPREVPGVLDEMGNACFLKGDEDSALVYLDRAVAGGRLSRVDGGINALYRAQVLMARRQHIDALQYLQQAIITFNRTFHDPDIHANPESFTGAFASYRLFDALYYKASILEGLYSGSGKGEYLEEALGAYNSAILLFRYIEKTYATDDAKLFLKRNNRNLYEDAVLACLELDRLHPGGPYLEMAFQTAEKSKASIVSARWEELALNHLAGVDPSLVAKEMEVKHDIARLDLKSDGAMGTMKNDAATAGEKADYEIELASLQRTMEQNSAYYNLKFEDACPTVRELQAGLNNRQAIVSLFVSREGLHAFLVTRNGFHCLFIDSLAWLKRSVESYINMLSTTDAGTRFGDKALESTLYRRLTAPLVGELPGKTEWTVLPDNFFCKLPFDALPLSVPGRYLIDSVTVGYQLSAKFLSRPLRRRREQGERYSVLAFAPFAEQGRLVQTPAYRQLCRLAGSGPETAGLPGERYVDAMATKARFLATVNRYPVVHLATHAWMDSANAAICFYPQQAGPEDDCLFLPEIYSLNLDSTELVILSACESGNGQIEGNEGMMSLSRAFMYAGCASTVNSLWKADDRATSAILRQFHVYLEKGLSKTDALRRAKLDYIHSNALYISPNYWAHLVLVGDTGAIVSPSAKRRGWQWITLFIVAVVVGGGVAAALIWRARSAGRARSSA